MMPLAKFAALKGYNVSGADRALSPKKEAALRSAGITTYHEHDPSRIDRFDAVVYSTAIREDHPERVRAAELAREGKAELLHRMDLLNRLTEERSVRIGVGGTHGKTSSSSMLGWLLMELGYDPDILVGGHPLYLEEGIRVGRGDVAVFETDESDGSFLKSHANVRILLNVDADHLDHYGNYPELKRAFRRFAEEGELTVLNGDDPYLRNLFETRIGEEIENKEGRAHWTAYSTDPHIGKNLQQLIQAKNHNVDRFLLSGSFEDESGGPADRLHVKEEVLEMILPGRHFAGNALGVLGALFGAVEGGILHQTELFSPKNAVHALNRFRGVERRVEFLGEVNGGKVYDDYGHHPTEIRAVIRALRGRMGGVGRITAVFQPHRYTRTRDLYKEFALALLETDRCYLSPLYSAGESPISGIDSGLILNELQQLGHDDTSLLPWEHLASVFNGVKAGDVVVFLGAGDISSKIRHFLSKKS